jgi:hypothetical protein
MADLRITGGAQPPAIPSQRSEAVRSAQRAFFQAALNEVAPTAPVRSAQTQPTAQVRTAAAPSQSSAAEPSRYARPGSLLDIKV